MILTSGPDRHTPAHHMSAALLAGVVILLCSLPVSVAVGSDIAVTDAWVRAAPPNAPMAGYMKLLNHGPRSRVLKAVWAKGFAHGTVHETVVKDGVASMSPVEALEVPAHGKLDFEPGGLHIMLMRPQRRFAVDDSIPVTLEFRDGTRVHVSFPVVKTGQ